MNDLARLEDLCNGRDDWNGTARHRGRFRASVRGCATGLPLPTSPHCFVWCEELTYALADELIFTSESQLEYRFGSAAWGLAEAGSPPSMAPLDFTARRCFRGCRVLSSIVQRKQASSATGPDVPGGDPRPPRGLIQRT